MSVSLRNFDDRQQHGLVCLCQWLSLNAASTPDSLQPNQLIPGILAWDTVGFLVFTELCEMRLETDSGKSFLVFGTVPIQLSRPEHRKRSPCHNLI